MPHSPFRAHCRAGAFLALLLAAAPVFAGVPSESAATAVNTLGLELLQRAGSPGGNTALSPFSIQTALVMTYAGADGETRRQMAKTLHLKDDAVPAFAVLQKQITSVPETVTLAVANRLFGQSGYGFRPAYLDLVEEKFGAPLEELDFRKDPAKAVTRINGWVEKQTRDRIRDLVPSLARDTSLVLVNAIYFKAPWSKEFSKSATAALPFHLAAGEAVDVPTMTRRDSFGYRKEQSRTIVTLPYVDGNFQFVVILPDAANGLAELEKSLTAADLAGLAGVNTQPVKLFLPKFKLEPPRFALGEILQELGMPSAFDVPRGSANFEGIAPRSADKSLFISNVFHKAFVEVEEKGTEAAAATAVVMMTRSAPVAQPEPVEVRVDRPFLFAIQHRPSGACLFLGRVTDPR